MLDPVTRHPLLAAALALAAAVTGAAGAANPEPAAGPRPVLARRAATDTARALHLLRRATWGPRPADLEAVLRLGPEAWLDRQLHPERIDDRALQAHLAAFPAASMPVAELFAAYPSPRRQNARGDSMTPRARRMRGEQPPGRILVELAEARLARAVHSERQLEDVMADFWFNHFNVFWGKGADRYLVADYERSAIRPHVFGRFRDMLGASAKHPAMLFYLDNWTSVAHDSMRPPALRDSAMARGGPRRPRGLNENYARELLELHTLGVDGGYTQDDVIAVARAFTGWTITAQRAVGSRPPTFIYRSRVHDRGEKTVLGHRLPPGRGMQEGEEVLDLLARHPATARHLAYKLVQRFVSDEPPADLVDELARVYLSTDGDLRAVTRALFLSAEFDRAREAKVSTPFEFIAAALRASGAEVRPSRDLMQTLRGMGHVPYLEDAPTGYPHTREEWTSASAMLARMTFAQALAGGRVAGVQPAPAVTAGLPQEPRALTRALAARVLPGARLPEQVAAAITDDLAAQPPAQRPVRALGLLLGSPTFQRR